MGNSCSPGCRWLCLCWRLFVLSFFPLDVLDEIWDVIESVSEGYLTYFARDWPGFSLEIFKHASGTPCLVQFGVPE